MENNGQTKLLLITIHYYESRRHVSCQKFISIISEARKPCMAQA